MACIYKEHDSAPVAEIRVVGRLTQHDMDQILPQLDAFIDRHGKIRLVEVIERFDGVQPGTVLDGLKFDYGHLRDITHAAVVSDMGWVGVVTRAASMILPVTIRTYPLADLEKARAWAEDPEN